MYQASHLNCNSCECLRNPDLVLGDLKVQICLTAPNMIRDRFGDTRGAARGKLMVATASSMEFRLAATSGRKLHARIHDDAAAASRHSMKVAFSDSL